MGRTGFAWRLASCGDTAGRAHSQAHVRYSATCNTRIRTQPHLSLHVGPRREGGSAFDAARNRNEGQQRPGAYRLLKHSSRASESRTRSPFANLGGQHWLARVTAPPRTNMFQIPGTCSILLARARLSIGGLASLSGEQPPWQPFGLFASHYLATGILRAASDDKTGRPCQPACQPKADEAQMRAPVSASTRINRVTPEMDVRRATAEKSDSPRRGRTGVTAAAGSDAAAPSRRRQLSEPRASSITGAHLSGEATAKARPSRDFLLHGAPSGKRKPRGEPLTRAICLSHAPLLLLLLARPGRTRPAERAPRQGQRRRRRYIPAHGATGTREG